MSQLVINGGKPLSGEVLINGAKNAAVAIIPSSIVTNGICRLENLPNIEDVNNILIALEKLGSKYRFVDKHTLEIDNSKLDNYLATDVSIRKMRASYYLLGGLLGRFKKAEVLLPGGCNFGSRPIDLHIKGLEALGATVKIENGSIKAHADELKGATIYLDSPSVGATINIMLAAIRAKGKTIIENAAKEPHIIDTANFLNMLGAQIKGAGTDIIRINGTDNLGSGEYTIIPDQIEAGSYMIASAITNGDVTIKNIIPKHLEVLSTKLREMNCEVIEGEDFVRVIGTKNLVATNVKTMPYPGFPTDWQPQISTLLACSKGNSVVTETIFDNRFQYVTELERMGAKVHVDGHVAHITGVKQFSGAHVYATDLRAGIALVLAGLNAIGETKIGDVKYIDRGYESIEGKLSSLGADIKRVEE